VGPGIGLIFDLDGVIVHSNPVHREAWRRYNLRFGIRTDEAMLARMYGRHNDAIVRDYFGAGLSEGEVAMHGAAKEALYREMIGPRLEECLVPGVREFLERHDGVPMAVASNAEPANVKFVLGTADLDRLFRAVVDGASVRRPKPFPDVFLAAADALGLAPEACIVFEDSGTGVAAARAAGMRTVGVHTTHEELPGVSLAIDDFRSAELERWLRSQSVVPV
jgi:beta-phosphoglucomutase family hydrolase